MLFSDTPYTINMNTCVYGEQIIKHALNGEPQNVNITPLSVLCFTLSSRQLHGFIILWAMSPGKRCSKPSNMFLCHHQWTLSIKALLCSSVGELMKTYKAQQYIWPFVLYQIRLQLPFIVATDTKQWSIVQASSNENYSEDICVIYNAYSSTNSMLSTCYLYTS